MIYITLPTPLDCFNHSHVFNYLLNFVSNDMQRKIMDHVDHCMYYLACTHTGKTYPYLMAVVSWRILEVILNFTSVIFLLYELQYKRWRQKGTKSSWYNMTQKSWNAAQAHVQCEAPHREINYILYFSF